MKGLSKKDNRNQRYITKGLFYVKKFLNAVKKRQIKSEFQNTKIQLSLKVQSYAQKLQQESIRESLGNRKNGFKLSWSLARRNVSRSKYRSALLITGIILTIALETGIVISIDTLYDDFIFDNRNQNYTDITVTPLDWKEISDIREVARTTRAVSGVSKASPVYYTTVNQFLDQSIPSNIYIYGIDSSTHPDYSSMNITEGKRTVKDNFIVISESIKQYTGVQVGESLDLDSTGLGFDSQIVTIGGIIADEPFFGNKFGFLFILVDIETLYEIVPENQRSEMLSVEIDCKVTNLVHIKRTKENIKDELGVGYIIFAEKDIADIEATGIRAYQTAMNLVILASFVVEFLFITNILAISIRERSKEFGILRAVGGRSYQLIESVAFEILIYSIIGCTIGVGLGIVFSTFLVGIMDTFYVNLNIEGLSLHFSSISATYLSGVIVALISGLYPIFLAISMPVVQNIHSRMRSGRFSQRWGQSWKYTLIAGILLATVGFSLQFFIGPSRFLDFQILSVHFLAVILIFIGTLLLEIGILFFLPTISMKLMIGFNVITRTISTRNIGREFQKSLFTIMTSAMALTFIIVVGLVSAAVVAGVPDYFENQWGVIDLVAETRDTSPLPTDFTTQLEADSRITRSSFIQEFRTDINEIDSYVFGVDPAKYAFFAEPAVDTNSVFPTFVLLNQTSGNRTNGLISHLLFQKLKTTLGSNVTVTIADNTTVNITLKAVIKSNIFLGSGEYLYIPSFRYEEFFNLTDANWFICDVEGDVERVQTWIEFRYPQFKPGGIMGITYFTEMMERSLTFQSAIFQVLFIESFILAAIAQFVCILVSTLRMEREVGIMRSLGLNRRGVFGIFMTESIALGITALFIGLLDGFLGSVLLAWYLSLSIPIKVKFPLQNIAIWLAISFLITICSTILPSYRSSRKNVVATISGRPMVKSYVEKKLYGAQKGTLPYGPINGQIKGLQSQDPLIHRLRPLETSTQSMRGTDGVLQFIKGNMIYVQTVFLILMAIVTFNYIFDESIIIRGLISFDYISRLLLSVIILPYDEIEFNPLFLVNPFLLIVGISLIIPFSHYLTRREMPRSLVRSMLHSSVVSIVGTVVLLLFLGFLIVIATILFIPIQEHLNRTLGYDNLGPILFVFLAFLIIAGIWLLLYQRFWCFMVTRGIESDLSLRGHIRLIRKYGSFGAIGFIFLLLLHSFFQVVLFYFIGPFPANVWDSYLVLPSQNHTPVLEPIKFLIYSVYEVGYFMLLVIYQIAQYKKYLGIFPNIEPHDVEYEEAPSGTIVFRSQKVAERILLRNPTGVDIQHDGLYLFSEARDGINLLFFQDSVNNIPVAMNFSIYYPKRVALLSENIPIRISVPSTDQMGKFLDFVKGLDLVKTN
ncbi:MAG: FtsX-like permease family protein [Candidatus Hodarchaeales archaeon]|jgi:putative ABC transport system permease protein